MKPEGDSKKRKSGVKDEKRSGCVGVLCYLYIDEQEVFLLGGSLKMAMMRKVEKVLSVTVC